MSFVFDESNVGMQPLQDGEYEVYPSAWSRETAKSGNDMIQINYRVREDVQQSGQGQEIRYDNFVLVPASAWRMNALTKAVGQYPDKYDFGTVENWAAAMMGKPVRVSVERVAQPNGKIYPEVKSFSASTVPQMTISPKIKQPSNGQQAAAATRYAPSPQQPSQGAFTQPSAPSPSAASMGNTNPFPQNGKTIDISDDDLPF